MKFLSMTKSGGLLGPFAIALGFIMDAIFNALDVVGMPNIGMTIIVFTIVVNLLMLPLTIKQQKSMKLNQVITPEIQAINNKYKGKNDQESMMKMNSETRAVYEKYGTSPTGGCLPLLIQMPILFALYRVIYNVPAYVGKIKDVYTGLITALQTAYPDYAAVEGLAALAKTNNIKGDLSLTNKMVDLMYTFDSSEWGKFTEIFPDITNQIAESREVIDQMNSFLTLNLAQSPNFTSISILIPILAGLTQWLSSKITMASTEKKNDKNQQEDPTANTMKTMNTIMPIMSVAICFSLPAGVGLYWVASSVVRTVMQLIINKSMDKMDIDELVAVNLAKANKKREKQGLPPVQPSKNVTASIKEIKAAEAVTEAELEAREKARIEKMNRSTEYYKSGQAKPGSLAAKAGMVQQYNEKNSNKK